MKSKVFSILLILCMLAAFIAPAVAQSSGFETVYSGWVDSGEIVTANGCYVNATVSSSSSAHVYVRNPNYPSGDVVVTVGNPYYYQNVLRVYVVSINTTTNKILLELSKPVSSGGDVTPVTGTRVTCEIPGQQALAGDLVEFPIFIQNNDDVDKTYTLTYQNDYDWKAKFTSGGKAVYKLFVPARGSKIVDFEVQTTGASTIGEKKVTAFIDNVRIDLYAFITSVNQSVEVTTKVSSKIASIGDKIYYEVSLKNLQTKENIYRLSVSGLPENWYYRFLENPSGVDEMAEVVVPANFEKMIYLEIVPPYTVTVGDFNFTAQVQAPGGTIAKKNLSLTLKSGVSMDISSYTYAYDSKPGAELTFDVYVKNSGRGAALTGVYLETKAPEGWVITVSPNRTNTIKAGETQVFRVKVLSPGSIVASDYKISVTAKSDQAEKSDDYRITIKTESWIPYIGIGIILLVIVGLAFMYWKYGRR